VTHFVVGALLLAAIVVSIGAAARAARRLLLPRAEGPSAHIADAVITLGSLVVVAEIVGTFGEFRRGVLAGSAIAMGVLSWALLRAAVSRRLLPRPASAGAGRGGSPPGPYRSVYWVGLAGCALVAGQWGSWISLPFHQGIVDYDSLNYHLTFAAQFVHSGSLNHLHYVSPDTPVHLYPQNAELLHAIGMLLLGSDFLSIFINVGWLMFAIACGWAIGRRFGLGPATGLAVATVMAVPILTATQAGNGGNDAAALALFLAVVAIFLTTPPSLGSVFILGLASGLGIGTKLTVIAPCLLVAVAMIVRAKAGQRVRALGVWLLPVLLVGSYWYARNVLITGSPDSSVDLSVAGIGFPYQPFQLVVHLGFSVADYWNNWHVWRTSLIPGLAALGHAWWELLLIVGAGSVFALVRRRGELRLLAALALLSALLYVITPTTAIGTQGRPILFAENLRYLTPALAAGLMAVVLLSAGRRERWQLATVGAIAAILAGTVVPGPWAPWPWPYRSSEIWFGLGSAGVLLAGAGLGHLRRPSRNWPVLAAAAAASCLAIAVGAALNRRYERERYARDVVYSWIGQHLHHTRIAIAGFDRQYPLWGASWTNYVQYVGMIQPHGGFTVAQSCRAWGTALQTGGFSYVVLKGDLLYSYPHGFPEFKWTLTSDRRLKAVFAGAGAIVLKLTRPLDPALCPPGERAARAF
jgi:hypothetical protein